MRFLGSFRRPWVRISLITIGLIAAISLIAIGIWFGHNLQPVSDSTQTQLFTVSEGSSVHEIGNGLDSLGLIRSSKAFVFYVDIKHFNGKLQAGTYNLKPSMSTQEIAQTMAFGYIDKDWVTILPGKRIDQIKQTFLKVGYSDAEVEEAFNPNNYLDEPLVASLPNGATLEGLLYPDSFQRDGQTPAKALVKESIEETESKLTTEVVTGFATQGLSPYQGLTLASIVYQESGAASDQPTVAQVFLSRLKKGIMLGSDVTAFYAANIAGADKTLGVDSPYNTRIHTGLPPGPIGSVTDSALQAVAHPSNTDYLFFVAGDDGTLHFTHTEAEHEAAIKKYCTKQCS